jgi:glycogen synthase
VHSESAPAAWNRYRSCVRRGLDGATLVAAPTQAMLRSLSHEHGYDSAGRVLSNGLDAERFEASSKQEVVLAAGRFWDDAKNLAALQAVAPQLDWPVRIAGAGVSADAKANAQAKRNGAVQALGELAPTAMAREMAAASIYALPARYEPFGLSILEAALSGCALVLGDISSLREIWGDAALYVAPDDHAALANTLQQLIADPALRARHARAARARGLHFSARRMADACMDAYADLNPRFERSRLEEASCA